MTSRRRKYVQCMWEKMLRPIPHRVYHDRMLRTFGNSLFFFWMGYVSHNVSRVRTPLFDCNCKARTAVVAKTEAGSSISNSISTNSDTH